MNKPEAFDKRYGGKSVDVEAPLDTPISRETEIPYSLDSLRGKAPRREGWRKIEELVGIIMRPLSDGRFFAIFNDDVPLFGSDARRMIEGKLMSFVRTFCTKNGTTLAEVRKNLRASKSQETLYVSVAFQLEFVSVFINEFFQVSEESTKTVFGEHAKEKFRYWLTLVSQEILNPGFLDSVASTPLKPRADGNISDIGEIDREKQIQKKEPPARTLEEIAHTVFSSLPEALRALSYQRIFWRISEKLTQLADLDTFAGQVAAEKYKRFLQYHAVVACIASFIGEKVPHSRWQWFGSKGIPAEAVYQWLNASVVALGAAELGLTSLVPIEKTKYARGNEVSVRDLPHEWRSVSQIKSFMHEATKKSLPEFKRVKTEEVEYERIKDDLARLFASEPFAHHMADVYASQKHEAHHDTEYHFSRHMARVVSWYTVMASTFSFADRRQLLENTWRALSNGDQLPPPCAEEIVWERKEERPPDGWNTPKKFAAYINEGIRTMNKNPIRKSEGTMLSGVSAQELTTITEFVDTFAKERGVEPERRRVTDKALKGLTQENKKLGSFEYMDFYPPIIFGFALEQFFAQREGAFISTSQKDERADIRDHVLLRLTGGITWKTTEGK